MKLPRTQPLHPLTLLLFDNDNNGLISISLDQMDEYIGLYVYICFTQSCTVPKELVSQPVASQNYNTVRSFIFSYASYISFHFICLHLGTKLILLCFFFIFVEYYFFIYRKSYRIVLRNLSKLIHFVQYLKSCLLYFTDVVCIFYTVAVNCFLQHSSLACFICTSTNSQIYPSNAVLFKRSFVVFFVILVL